MITNRSKSKAVRTCAQLLLLAGFVTLSIAVLSAPAVFAATCGTGADGKPLELGIGVDCGTATGSPIIAYVSGIIKVLVPIVGIAVVGIIAVGGIMISSANGNAAQVQKGVEYIRNAIIALVLFIFMNVILKFLLPGV